MGTREGVTQLPGHAADGPDGELTLAHIYSSSVHFRRRSYNDYQAAQYVHARGLLEAARDEARVGAELRWSPCASPGRGLHELPETLGSELLVVGSG